MRIHSVRLGHAMNSSSSHSLIFLAEARDDDGGGYRGHYGWENFTLVTAGAKRAYLAQTLFHNLVEMAGSEVAAVVAEAWAGAAPDPDGYIDHQSVLALPMDWAGKAVDREFFQAYLAHALRDDVAVLGGNDNDDGHPLAGQGPDASGGLKTEESSLPWRCRRDPAGHWTLFNRRTGAKLRIDFDDMASAPAKAGAPELVDVKISDYCPLGCAWCYQDSDEHGKHAPRETLSSVARALGDLKVFECAIGGGEPTLHPEFGTFLAELRGRGVNANFTTRLLGWLEDPQKVKHWLGDTGGFAYSAHNAGDVLAMDRACKRAGVDTSRTTAQHVMGTSGRADFGAVLAACAETRVPLTLLGFKAVGRGAGSAAVLPHDWWIEDVKASQLWQVRIDTALAKQYEDALVAADVSRHQFETAEGAFSCYLDAVSGEIAPSSYCGREKYMSWPDPPAHARHGGPEIGADALRGLFAAIEAA